VKKISPPIVFFFYLEPAAALVFLVFPPIFGLAPRPGEFSFPTPAQGAVLAVLCAYFLVSAGVSGPAWADSRSPCMGLKLFWSAAGLLGMFLWAGLLSAAQFFLGVKAPPIPEETRVMGSLLPRGLFFFALAGSACFEEALYRVYLPRRFRKFVENPAAWEIAATFFAAAHKAGGGFAIANAFGAALILQFSLRRTRSVASICVMHTLYNIVFYLVMYGAA
jgi:membrane protease YdiL (CAAX protease family)